MTTFNDNRKHVFKALCGMTPLCLIDLNFLPLGEEWFFKLEVDGDIESHDGQTKFCASLSMSGLAPFALTSVLFEQCPQLLRMLCQCRVKISNSSLETFCFV